jgi:hypothetical protein
MVNYLKSNQNRILLLLVISVFSSVVFYKIGLNSLWVDETLVPLASRFPVSYILERSLSTDTHPPGFYLIIKAWTILGSSDGILRSFSALCGVVALYVIYRLGCVLRSERVGVISAALLSSNMLFVSLAREVRPYSLLVLLYCSAAYALFSFRQGGRTGWLFLLCVGVLPLLHFGSYLYLAALFMYFIYDRNSLKKLFLDNKILSFVSLALVSVSFVFFYFRSSEFSHPGTFADTLVNVMRNVALLVDYGSSFYYLLYINLFVIFCGFVLLFRDRCIFFYLLCCVAVPVSILVLFRYSSYSNPWHYVLFLVPFCVSTSIFLDAVVGRFSGGTVFSVCIVLAILCYQVDAQSSSLYEHAKDSTKEVSAVLSGMLDEKSSFFTPEQTQFHSIGRYLSGQVRDLYIAQKVLPGDKSWKLYCTGDGSCRHLSGLDPVPVGTSELRCAVIERHPRVSLALIPDRIKLQFDPGSFFASVNHSDGVQVDAPGAYRLIPTENNKIATFSYVFETSEGRYPYVACLVFGYGVKSQGSILRVYCKVDGNDRKILFSSGKDLHRSVVPLYMVFDESFSRLEISVEMECGLGSPQYSGGNLGTIYVEEMMLYFSGYRDGA